MVNVISKLEFNQKEKEFFVFKKILEVEKFNKFTKKGIQITRRRMLLTRNFHVDNFKIFFLHLRKQMVFC